VELLIVARSLANPDPDANGTKVEDEAVAGLEERLLEGLGLDGGDRREPDALDTR